MQRSMISVFIYFCAFVAGVFSDPDLPKICPTIVSRSRWGARAPLEVEYAIIPVENVIIHHTVTPECNTEQGCSRRLKSIQNFQMEELDFHDIGYNFLVGGDGLIYEGTGWHKVGAHTKHYNTKSLCLAFIGDFSNELPNSKQLQAAKNFLQCGVELGELSTDYKLFAAKQVSATQSPGLKLYHNLRKWSHFTSSPPLYNK